MRTLPVVFLGVMLVTAMPVRAEDDPSPELRRHCMSDDCWFDALERAEKALNDQYQATMKALEFVGDDDDEELKESVRQTRTALLEAQQKWLELRDLDCEVGVAWIGEGTARIVERLACETRMTRERTVRLRRLQLTFDPSAASHAQ